MDYTQKIDAQTWAFIRETASYYPEKTVEFSIEDQRKTYDTMCRAFYQGRPPELSVQDQTAAGVPVRIYSAGEPTVSVVYFHGGGYVVGGLDSHDDVCAEFAAQAGYRLVSVDYRLSPEHKHPAAFEDSWAVTQWVAEHFDGPIVLAGDSAGGNLAAAVAHHARGRLKQIIGQVLIYPGLGGDPDKGSYLEHANAPMLTRDEVLFYKDVRLDGPAPQNDPTYAPLQDTDFSGLPSTLIVTADCDPLRDDGSDYYAKLKEAGCRVALENEPGLVHGYLRARATVDRARDSFDRIAVAIEALGQGVWPYD